MEKHNWFSLNGDIRINKEMTVNEFLEQLDKIGFEFLGKASISEFSDSDYEMNSQIIKEDSLRNAVASAEIEGHTLTYEQLSLLRKSMNGKITEDEFLIEALKLAREVRLDE